MASSSIDFTAGTAPATPAAGHGVLYHDPTEGPSWKDDDGKVRRLDSGILTVTRHLTSADLLQLKTNPAVVIAGEPGIFFWIRRALLLYWFGTTAYFIDSDTTVSVGLKGDQPGIGPFKSSIIVSGSFAIGALGDAQIEFGPIVNAAPPAEFPNVSIVGIALTGADIAIWCDSSFDPTGGNGVADLFVEYARVPMLEAVGLAFGIQPSAAVANATIVPAVTVRVLDQNGDLFTKVPLAVSVALTVPGSATLAGTLTRNSDITTGLATFDDLAVDVVDTYTLTAFANSPLDFNAILVESDPFVISAP